MLMPYNFPHFTTPYYVVLKTSKKQRNSGMANLLFVRAFSEVQTVPAGIWLFHVDNAGTGVGTLLIISFWSLYSLLWSYFAPFFWVSIVGFKHAVACSVLYWIQNGFEVKFGSL